MQAMVQNVRDAAQQYPKPAEFTPSYGTAGFRAKAELLTSTVFRCGLLMGARALKTGQDTGIVVTASHNPAADNGVKLVEPTGLMLVEAWESWADKLATAADADALAERFAALLKAEGIEAELGKTNGDRRQVLLAHDTRPSASELIAAAAAGVEAAGCAPVQCGLHTTPQLHWMLRSLNRGQPGSERDYYASLAAAFQQLVHDCPAPQQQELTVDCANGVGAHKLAALAPQLEPAGLRLALRATGDGELNGGCGSDFVQKERELPAGFGRVEPGARCASIDGDGDRLVYFTPRPDGGGLLLLDGDRIATLAALTVQRLLAELPAGQPPVSVGIVQTAYANGGSTRFIRDKLPGVSVAVTPTGVKFLHHAAEAFDVGIYFEANGHGTVLFAPALVERLQPLAADNTAAAGLLALEQLNNQAVGDAISGILLVEVALRRRGWGLPDWAALYADLPSRQSKVLVKDRSVVETADAETRVVAPAGLQAAIDAEVAKVASGRSFVRPSGTEDVVRVYAEAATQEEADALAAAVGRQVERLAGGL